MMRYRGLLLPAVLISLLYCSSPCFSSKTDTLTSCQDNLQRIASGLESYSADHQGNYPETLDALNPDYMKELPSCPITSWSYGYDVSHHPDFYTVLCRGWAHRNRIGEENPLYSAISGLTSKHDPVPTEEEENHLKQINKENRSKALCKIMRDNLLFLIIPLLIFVFGLYILQRRGSRER